MGIARVVRPPISSFRLEDDFEVVGRHAGDDNLAFVASHLPMDSLEAGRQSDV